jgi:magnesium transporter
MIVNSYELDEALHLNRIDSGSVVDACRREDARIWIDIEDSGSKKGEVDAWLDDVGIDGLARRLLLEARDRPGFYPLKTEICFVIPVLTVIDGCNEVDYVGLVCRENLLLTLHGGSLLNRQRVAELQDSASWMVERSIAALVSALLIKLSLACLQNTTVLRSAIVSLDEQLDRDAEAVEASQLSDLRSRVLALERVATDQLPSLQALATTDKPFFHLKDTHEYLNCALVNFGTARRILERADRSIDELRSRLDMYAQDKTNRRLGMLTILSAIFMPITLLAGIWGMNFPGMPELTIPYGYPMALGLMAFVGTAMYLFFRRHGWLG